MKLMKHDNRMNRPIACLLIYSQILVGCAANSGQNGIVKAGPPLSSGYEASTATAQPDAVTAPKLDVIIPVFDPGLSENAENYEEEGIWPELRRAEANRFAYKLKAVLDKTGEFGAVRVTPDNTASGDLYILGSIKESDGEIVKLNINVLDISGREWLDRDFKHKVRKGFFKNIRTRGNDPYDPVFVDVGDAIIKALKKRKPAELENLQYIANLRFGASFNEAAFDEYMDTSSSYVKLLGKPSDKDPMLQRVSSIRVREQLFIDSLQQNYASFSSSMEESYLKWQEASFTEKQLRKKAQREGVMKAVGGVLMIGLAIAAGVASANKSEQGRSGTASTLTTAAVAGGLASAWLLSSSFKSREEAKLHKDAIDELGESINLGMAPQVVSFEEETVELTGNIQEQFTQWREFLKRIYEQEATPSTQL